jgi:ubiquinone/menaquinone biosynthesis C-methylase UbiE
MSLENELIGRDAQTYAEFLLPHLKPTDHVLDFGCGSGSISVGLGDVVPDGQVIAFDLDASEFGPATHCLSTQPIDSIRFVVADGTVLPFRDAMFDAVLCHSVLETLPNPLQALGEVMRVLAPGAVLGAASVDYGGLLLAGPDHEILLEFYRVREQLWADESIARPRTGRDLRGLFDSAGFVDVDADARYVSYGDPAAIWSFGQARAADCVDPWFSSKAIRHGLMTPLELNETERAWHSWAGASGSFLAFPWCHAIGHKPPGARRYPARC